MCGVAGLYFGDQRNVSQATVSAMIDALRHRGPDDRGVFVAPGIGLGHARLSIRDLSRDGHQPFVDPTGRIVVSYNGEIYNDGEIRSELERDYGFRFSTRCDTEVIPLGYLAWGSAIFDRLEGMFAVALWDRDEKRLLLARDGIGIKPLYFSEHEEGVRFASEIKGLFADPEQSQRLSPQGLHAFFAMGYVGPYETTYEGVRQVAPGTVLSFCRGKRDSRRFWRPSRKPEIRNVADALSEMEPIWNRVVGDQLISDVPVGVLLSGGVDSTLVALAANRPERKLPFFTASFATEAFDETPIAREVASSVGTELHSIPVEARSDLGDLVAQVVRHFDGQSCDEASVALYLLSREVRRHVTVALTGDGGDEFFAGYPTYGASKWGARVGPCLPSAAWAALGRLCYGRGLGSQRRLPLTAIMSRFAQGVSRDPATAHVSWRRYIPEFLLPKLYGPALRPLMAEDPFAGYRAELESAEGDLIDRCLLADQRWHLPGGLLLKSDAMSMAHSLELRVPLLDRRIMDFAGRCHSDLLLSPEGQKKALLRRLATELHAPRSVTNGAKRGFNAPLARLLRRELLPTAQAVFEKNADALYPFIDPAGVRSLWREHESGDRDHGYALWPILHFALSRVQH